MFQVFWNTQCVRKNVAEQFKSLVILFIDNKLKNFGTQNTDDKDNNDVALTTHILCTKYIEQSVNVTGRWKELESKNDNIP